MNKTSIFSCAVLLVLVASNFSCKAAIVKSDNPEDDKKQYELAVHMRQEAEAINVKARQEYLKMKAVSDARIMAMRNPPPPVLAPEVQAAVEAEFKEGKTGKWVYISSMFALLVAAVAGVWVLTKRSAAAREKENNFSFRRAAKVAPKTENDNVREYFATKMQSMQERKP